MINDNTILFAKLRDDVIIPSKREEDGAFDIYANFSDKYIMINPHETIMVSTGLISAFSSNYVAILKERGSTGARGIGQRAGVVDSGYRGEWMVPITNHNNKPLAIIRDSSISLKNVIEYPYSKAICQCIMVPVPYIEIVESTIEDISAIESERGEGKLGSSGK